MPPERDLAKSRFYSSLAPLRIAGAVASEIRTIDPVDFPESLQTTRLRPAVE
jgi:hypothetical protein